MMRKASTPSFTALALAGLLTACGSSNGNQIFTNPAEKDARDYLLSRAEYHFDKGEFDEAGKYAKRAWDENHQSEKAALLLGYIHLAKAGVDTFSLAQNLIDLSKGNGTTKLADAPAADKNSTPDVLGKLSGIVDMSNTELPGLTQDGAPQSTAVEAFRDYPVYLPKLSTEARATTGAFVSNIRDAVQYLCPFVSEEAKSKEDARQECPRTTNPTVTNDGGIHYVWAFVHLAEAVSFNKIVFYKNAEAQVPNLLSRVAALANLKKDVVSYATGAAELATTVDAIFPVGEDVKESMLNGIFNDLETTINAFATISGLPQNVKGSIEKAFTQLKAQRDAIAGTSTTLKNTAALKQQFTKAMKAGMGTQINDIKKNDPAAFQQNKAEICQAYVKIAGVPTNDLEACK